MAKKWASPPAMQIDPKKIYLITMETSKGVIEIQLFPQYAPKTVNNFVFFRPVKGFMMGSCFTELSAISLFRGVIPLVQVEAVPATVLRMSLGGTLCVMRRVFSRWRMRVRAQMGVSFSLPIHRNLI